MTESHPHLAPADEADLVALADGNLAGEHRAEVEARVAREPELAAALERQRCALSLLAGLSTTAPLELRVRVAELRHRRRRLRLRRWLPAGFVAAAAATAVMLLMIAGGSPEPEDIAVVALRPATARVAPGQRIDGVRFPRPAAWRAVGTRKDVIEGRTTRTVFYERDGRRVAYTIVSGPALERGRRVLPGGSALTWVRNGHSCVVSGRVPAAVLAKAAAWRA
jgi:anti-sigma factor RsiW